MKKPTQDAKDTSYKEFLGLPDKSNTQSASHCSCSSHHPLAATQKTSSQSTQLSPFQITTQKNHGCDKGVLSHEVIKCSLSGASLVAQLVKNLPSMQETQVRSLDQEDSLEKEMATHSSTLAWRIPWTEEPGGLQSMGLQSWTDCANNF